MSKPPKNISPSRGYEGPNNDNMIKKALKKLPNFNDVPGHICVVILRDEATGNYWHMEFYKKIRGKGTGKFQKLWLVEKMFISNKSTPSI